MDVESKAMVDREMDFIARLGETAGALFGKFLRRLGKALLALLVLLTVGPVCLVDSFIGGIRKGRV